MASTLTVDFLEKYLDPCIYQFRYFMWQDKKFLETIIVEPCTWCTPKFLEPF